MTPIDLFSMREHHNRQRILLSFNGPISRSLIEEIGNALRNYLMADEAPMASAIDVFGVYIELTQNIRHYTQLKGWHDQDASATVVVAHDAAGGYVVSAGNIVEQADGEALLARVEALAQLDKAALKARYKEQLRQPRAPEATTGAGLGLIDIARKASAPLQASLQALPDGRAFVSVSAVI